MDYLSPHIMVSAISSDRQIIDFNRRVLCTFSYRAICLEKSERLSPIGDIFNFIIKIYENAMACHK